MTVNKIRHMMLKPILSKMLHQWLDILQMLAQAHETVGHFTFSRSGGNSLPYNYSVPLDPWVFWPFLAELALMAKSSLCSIQESSLMSNYFSIFVIHLVAVVKIMHVEQSHESVSNKHLDKQTASFKNTTKQQTSVRSNNPVIIVSSRRFFWNGVWNKNNIMSIKKHIENITRS